MTTPAPTHEQQPDEMVWIEGGTFRTGSKEKSYDRSQPDVPIARRVLKGGSHLCAPNYCLRYRPAARQPQMVDTGMSHLGFRCVRRPK
jgi:formylglycine-generating enzyme required for sulfatase activity